MTPRRDLILAAAANYDWETLRPFVESLQSTGFVGEVRFFVSNLDASTAGRLRAAGIELTRPMRIGTYVGKRWIGLYHARLPRIVQAPLSRLVRTTSRLARDPRRATAVMAGAISNVDVARYFWYWRHLSDRVDQYRNVMLTDVRDVVFQGRPFDFDIDADVHFFLEADGITLASQWLNERWLRSAYGDEVVKRLGDRPVSCSGVTIGAASAVLQYLTVMVNELARLPRQPSGQDQGVHNFVLHTGLVPNARLVANGDGPVITLGQMASGDAERLVRRLGSRVKVLHQYDRHPELAAQVSGR